MTTEKFCTKCGRKFIAAGREVICPACREAAAEATKKAAVERAKMRSYTGEACPVRISAKARGFIEAVAKRQGCKFIPALDKVLQDVASKYGFSSWDAVPEHKTARRGERVQAAKTAVTVTAEPVKPATPVKASKATTSKKASSKPSKSVKEG